jgi:hypothetical protein
MQVFNQQLQLVLVVDVSGQARAGTCGQHLCRRARHVACAAGTEQAFAKRARSTAMTSAALQDFSMRRSS